VKTQLVKSTDLIAAHRRGAHFVLSDPRTTKRGKTQVEIARQVAGFALYDPPGS
jgi:RNA-binding protein YlmH